MQNIVYIASGYLYPPLDTRHLTGSEVRLMASDFAYHHTHTEGDLDDVRVIDFIVYDSNTEQVKVWIQGDKPEFHPHIEPVEQGGYYIYEFEVPAVGRPDFKWGVNDPTNPNGSTPTPAYQLRVTVKRQ